MEVGSVGAHAGCWLALPAGAAAAALAGPLAAVGVGAALIGAAAAAGAAAGALRSPLDDRGTALVLDRLTGSQELLLNALHAVERPEDPNRDAILARLATFDADPAVLAVQRPRHLRWAALPLALAAALVGLAPRVDLSGWWPTDPEDPVAAVGEELRERLQREAPVDGAALPPGLQQQVGDLADELSAGSLSPEDAERRLAELQEALQAHQDALAASQDLLSDLAAAAEALRAQAPELAEGLAEGDLGAASEAARSLAEHLAAEGTPEERQAAGAAMTQAGRALAGSTDPSLRRAGEAMRQAGEAMQQGEGALSSAQQQDLARELQQARDAGQQLARDQQALRDSQEAAAALEAARRQLGGAATVAQGEGEGDAPGDPRGDGPPGEGPGQPGNGAGTGHTWEDQGEFDEDPGQAGTAQADAGGGKPKHERIDDFQRLYDELRLQGAKSLVAGTNSQLHEEGRVDELPTRLTTAEEVAKTGAVALPATYRDAASEAVQGEEVPAGYRDAVKQYFDGME